MELEFGSVDASPKQWVPAPLPYPTGVNRNRIYWRYALAVGGYHMLGLLAFVPWFFSWQGAVLAIVGTLVILKICDVVFGVRVNKQDEMEGLDLSMHGEEGYNLES